MIELWVVLGISVVAIIWLSACVSGLRGKMESFFDREASDFADVAELREGLRREQEARRSLNDLVDELDVHVQAVLPESQSVLHAKLPSNVLVGGLADEECWIYLQDTLKGEGDADDEKAALAVRIDRISAIRRQENGTIKLWVTNANKCFYIDRKGGEVLWRTFWKLMGCPEPGTEVPDEELPSRRILLEDVDG